MNKFFIQIHIYSFLLIIITKLYTNQIGSAYIINKLIIIYVYFKLY